MHPPPRQAPRARDQTSGLRGTQIESSSAKSIITGIYKRAELIELGYSLLYTMAVVKGMLSMKDDAMADTQTITKMATNS